MYANNRLLAVVLVFTAAILSPIAILFVEGLRSEAGGISFGVLESLLLSSRQLFLIKNSVILAAGATFFSLLIGVPLALLINRTDLPFPSWFTAACLLPLVMPPYMQATVWSKFFGFHLGMPNFIYSLAGGVFVYTLSFFPFVTLITSSGLRSIDPALEEAAYMSRGFGKTVRGITLPLVAPHITSGGILVFVFTIVNFEAADILRLKAYPMEIFINFSAFYDESAATMLSVPLMALTLFLIWGQMVYMRDKSYAHFELSGRGAFLFGLGRFQPPALGCAATIVIIAVVIPLLLLIMGARLLQNYARVFEIFRDRILYSVAIAAISAFITAAFSLAVAYYLERGKGVIKGFLNFMTQTPFGIPSVVLGIGLIKVWNRPGLDWVYGSSIILALGYITACSPFVIKILTTKMKQIDLELEEVAVMAGRGWCAVWSRILVPLALPALIVAFLAGFVLSLGNLGTSLLIVPPGKDTIPIGVYNLFHYGAEDMVFSLNLLLILLVVASLAVLYPLYGYCVKKVRT